MIGILMKMIIRIIPELIGYYKIVNNKSGFIIHVFVYMQQ